MTTAAALEFRDEEFRDDPRHRPPALWPLTARSEELDFIAGALRRDGRPAGVVLAGDAGVGKTRLAREALAMASCRTVAPRWISATASARGLPLGAFGALVADETGAGLPTTAVLRRISDAVIAATTGRSVVVGVDDAHLLDPCSATVLHQLALRREVPLVVTVRSGEPAPDAVTALWKDGHLARLEVQPLSCQETGTLVESFLDGPLQGNSLHRLYAATCGNVLFLRHLIEGALVHDTLRRVSGVWQLGERATVTPQLAELVDAEIGTLSPGLHDVLEILAVAEPLDAALLVRLADPAVVEEADRRGLITVENRESRLEIRLAHPLYGEVLRGRASELRARRWRGRIARAMESAGPRSADDLLRQAVFALDSDSVPDPDLLNAASRTAAAMLDFRLAERLARASRDLGGGFEPHLSLCCALTWQSRPADAEAEAALLESRASCDAERSRAAIARAGNLFWELDDLDGAQAALDRAGALLTDPCCRDELAAFRAAIAYSVGDASRALELASRVLAAPDASETAVFWAAAGATGVWSLAGRCDAIGDLPRRASACAAGSFERSWLRFGLGAKEITALRLAGRLSEAAVRARGFEEGVTGAGLIPGAVSGILTGSVDLARGRVGTAVRTLRESAAAFAVHKPGSSWRVQCGIPLVESLVLLGESTEARVAMAAIEAADGPAARCLYPQIRQARAWLAVADGAVSEAVTIARQAADDAAALGQWAVEAHALHTAVRWGDTTQAGRLSGLAEQVDGVLVRIAARHAEALASSDGAVLDAVSGRFEEIGALLVAADAAAQAAAAHSRKGIRSKALVSTARAHRLAGACGNVRTPALRGVDKPLPLTKREREIADMIAAGLSNRDIARRLVVSVRTVEGHVYRACAKFGFGDRADLAALMRGI